MQDIYLFKEGNHFRLYEKLGGRITAQKNLNDFFGTLAVEWETVVALKS